MTHLGKFTDDPHYMTPEEEQRVIDRNREDKLLALDAQADDGSRTCTNSPMRK